MKGGEKPWDVGPGYAGNVDLDALGVSPGDRVVDVGCADGDVSGLLVRAGLRVVGIEPEAYLRERFARAVSGLGPGSAVVLEGAGEHLPLCTGTERFVLLTEVLEHVADPDAVVAELRRVLIRGGRLCVSVPTAATEWLYNRLHPGYAQNATHARIFGLEQLLDLLRRHEFEPLCVQGRNFDAAVLWVAHALLRSESDHAGKLLEHQWIGRVIAAGWAALRLLQLERVIRALGNRLLPKSWYIYARAV